MKLRNLALNSALYAVISLSAAHADTMTVCTAVADAASGATLMQEGDCERRATSASTFKIALSLMGYDAAVLKDAHTPALPFEEGYPDWNPSWRSTTDPAKWMKESVVWYSQAITRALGEERFSRYVREFQYGNQDVSGDPGMNNGLSRSWIGSSLEISPLEQLEFLRKFVRRELPVSADAYEMTREITEIGPQPNGWLVNGKTGAAASRNDDGTKAMGKPYGWFVGWATKGDRTIVFARLTRDTTKPSVPPGLAARNAVLRDLFSEGSDL